MANVEFTKEYRAKQRRVARSAAQLERMARAARKADAVQFVEFFRDGLNRNRLGLRPLAPQTVRRKRRRGYRRATSPLVARGDDDRRSLVQGLRIHDGGTTFPVTAGDHQHHTARMSVASLFQLHALGTRNLPPRPALDAARRQFLRVKLRSATPAQMARALARYVETGDRSALDKLARVPTSRWDA